LLPQHPYSPRPSGCTRGSGSPRLRLRGLSIWTGF